MRRTAAKEPVRVASELRRTEFVTVSLVERREEGLVAYLGGGLRRDHARLRRPTAS